MEILINFFACNYSLRNNMYSYINIVVKIYTVLVSSKLRYLHTYVMGCMEMEPSKNFIESLFMKQDVNHI